MKLLSHNEGAVHGYEAKERNNGTVPWLDRGNRAAHQSCAHSASRWQLTPPSKALTTRL